MIEENLSVIIPVYNEEAAIDVVIGDWHNTLASLNINFEIHAYDDGSKDRSLAVLKALQNKYAKLIVHTKQNSGHGPTILQGYLENLSKDWLFQIDSDNELRATNFATFWERRQSFDFLMGCRDGRDGPIARKIISSVSRLTVRFFYGSGVWDVNSPYRLMRSKAFSTTIKSLPRDTFAPNLIISGSACRQKLRIYEAPVTYSSRTTGEVSIKKWKLLKASMRSFAQTIAYRFRTRS